MSKVIIIGGGIIGLASAYYLRKQNHEVVVIDKGVPGEACSAGNMGWICPTLSQPLPSPGLILSSLKWMLKKENPLYIKPSAMLLLGKWFFNFWKYCNEASYTNGVNVGLQISKNTLNLFDDLLAEDIMQFENYKKGLLYVSLDSNELEKKYEEFIVGERIGLSKPIRKTKEEVLDMEPSLSENVVGGLYLPSERHVRPESLSKALHRWLEENGVEFLINHEVTDFEKKMGKIIAVKANSKRIEADHFLLTAGVWSKHLAKKIGFYLPLTAGKGYSITITSPNVKLNHPLYLGSAGISPFEDSIRFGGTMEFSGVNTNIDSRRVDSIRNLIFNYLKEPLTGSSEEVWSGMRPMTPDGIPVLGNVPGVSNLFIATGHVMSGVSMSLSTGYIMSELITNGQSVIDLNAVSPERFLK
ncbi:NAD(P)/FAD-dependent oxidoreductase [Brevibacillus sp. NRS-1366]|uniref:NAD(P)/FAD-dependent oxidoreductase n=1 Tax=Brevibacillus sp. NRS-1366 TaxID=3233899 RepID=UPI003D221815